MGKSEKRKNKNVCQAKAIVNPAKTTKQQVSNTLLSDNLHDYLEPEMDCADIMPAEVVFPSLPETPCKSPVIKQRKIESLDAANVLSQLKELSILINNRSDALERMVAENARSIASMKETVNENTKQIADVKTAVEFACAEVNDVKGQLGIMETQVKKIEAKSSEHEQRLSHLEAYTRRWNLRIYGMPEKEREDVRERVIQVCQQLLPEAKDKLPYTVDTVHRLGRKQASNDKPRGIIFQFTSRFYRDAIWRAAKDSPFLRNNNLKLSEDLSPTDREKRNKLWPLVDKARRDNKRAYFVGGRAFVDGTEIFPPT